MTDHDPTGDLPLLPTVLQQPTPPRAPSVSDSHLENEVGITVMAPTFRQASAAASVVPSGGLDLFQPGQCLGDFELLGLLGEGSFARVFLARQLSLGRQVALKVSKSRANEARTLASLEHDHIVHVFSEVVDPERGLRLLCMQYVPGTTLERVMHRLRAEPPRQWHGRTILDAIDQLSTHPALFDPAALRDRELLRECDFPETVCWLGARLAEALAHAHGLGVLHQDIKPANILLNRYGRPLLADFNVSCSYLQEADAAPRSVGGTLAYMSPEHMEAFLKLRPPQAIDPRSDIYALGVVLFELLTGRQPFSDSPLEPGPDYLQRVAVQRRSRAPAPQQSLPAGCGVNIPRALDLVVQRCLQPDPDQRYQSAAELARDLEGARQLHCMERDLPLGGPLTRAARCRPFTVGALLVLGPHVLGSLSNIVYNNVHIVSALTGAAATTFWRVTLIYNLFFPPLCLAIAYALLAPLYRTWRQLAQPGPHNPEQVFAMRRRALNMPLWGAALACLGWLPGGVIFPLVLRLTGEVEVPGLFAHFFISFTLSGLIALTYSAFGMQYIVLRVLYPQLWTTFSRVRPTARSELKGVGRRLLWLQLLAVLIPLSGAVLLLGSAPDNIGASAYRTLRLLLVSLIALGMLGLGMALIVSSLLSQTLTVFVGGSSSGLQAWFETAPEKEAAPRSTSGTGSSQGSA
jgi:serine/threonine protein kinase